MTITGKGNYKGTTTTTYTISKATDPMKLKARTATVKYSKLKKKTQKLAVSRIITFTKKGQGTMSYKLVSAKKGSKSFKTLEQFETYVEDTSIPSDHRTRHYVYTPGDTRFYPVLNVYVSEESGQLLQIELNYNEHDLRDETWKLHEEMCFAATGVLMPDLGAKDLTILCREVNALAAEKIVPHEKHFGKDMVPGVLICHNGIGVYPYFAVGSRSHFCVIPVDEEIISKYQEAGTEIRKQ